MDSATIPLLLLFLGLLVSGMWIPFAVGIAALAYLIHAGGVPSLTSLGLVSWGSMNSFTLTAIPLFILMAEILLESGLSQRIFRGLSQVVRFLPGGLLQTNIAGCAVFAAVSGSSVACAASIGTVSVPQLRQRGYDMSLAAGTLAAGGTLGILIPPSIAMIVYGTFAETSIAKLFLAGIVPGLILTGLFMLYIGIRAVLNPTLAPKDNSGSTTAWLAVVNDVMPFGVMIILLMGSLYSGIVTPTEAAALGCCIAWLVSKIWGDMSFSTLRRAMRKSVIATGSILFVVYAAFLFSYAIGMAGIAKEISEGVTQAGISKEMFLLFVILALTILGCFVDSMGMMVITVPILLPSLHVYNIDPIWFGILIVLLVELGQVTPPMGMNLFVIKNISGESLSSVIKGTMPFYGLYLLLMALIYFFPQIVLWLPGLT
ncbi:TRAP transporter large permease subunit [Alcaligenaceae bacterium LF4-65]|jgi:C4-dicarboxylate transporter, DctM subunit|uniref:TRAP transporter large permease protein n=1 Tax=Zwartia hollandica TaxID=324606 RepID=A0A953NER1_9BURK|nr:TRAP transporter large permease subunit [Zwartia hollandica]MBZ1351871.1 TRAP transporter large permease subunit [Zwartia hollandica]